MERVNGFRKGNGETVSSYCRKMRNNVTPEDIRKDKQNLGKAREVLEKEGWHFN